MKADETRLTYTVVVVITYYLPIMIEVCML